MNRLNLIRSRFATLRGVKASPASGTSFPASGTAFVPVPAPRHSLTGGGVKFYSNPILPDEPLPADFVPAQVEDYQPLAGPEIQAHSNAWARFVEDVESLPLRLTA